MVEWPGRSCDCFSHSVTQTYQTCQPAISVCKSFQFLQPLLIFASSGPARAIMCLSVDTTDLKCTTQRYQLGVSTDDRFLCSALRQTRGKSRTHKNPGFSDLSQQGQDRQSLGKSHLQIFSRQKSSAVLCHQVIVRTLGVKTSSQQH